MTLDYQRLFEGTPAPMLVLNADLQIVAVNEAYLQTTMTSREDIVGLHLFEVFPDNPDDPAATGVRNLRASLETVLTTRRPHVMAFQKYDIRTEDGSFEVRHWSPINTPVLGEHGEVELIIHRVEDVTSFVAMTEGEDRRRVRAAVGTRIQQMETELYYRAQDLQVLNARLQEAQEGKDRFLAALSHELRNPLSAIRGALDVLDDELGADRDPVSAREMLEVIDRQTTALTRLTDDLLDITRARVRKLALRRAAIDVSSLVAAEAESARTHTKGGPAIVTELPPYPVWAEGDVERLAQAIGNLVSNAIKFSAPDGTVTISVSERGGRATVRVADDGPGFDPGRADELFEPFTQADTSLARATTGLGLGLSIVRSVIEVQGGTVSAHSDGQGRGATFTIEMPATEARSSRERGPARVMERAKTVGRQMLVIEDNDDVGAAYLALLEQLGHAATLERSGAAGIEAAINTLPDAVLCDIGLPDVDGYEVARRLRADERTAATPLIAISGYGRLEDYKRARAAGFNHHLVKPISLETLAETLSSVSGDG